MSLASRLGEPSDACLSPELATLSKARLAQLAAVVIQASGQEFVFEVKFAIVKLQKEFLVHYLTASAFET
jgi:hypothetical protein